jgi:NADPH:quinone reductase-like Zn-dependent oxidoreductase
MSAWDALIRKSDLREVEVVASDAPDRTLAEGEVLLAVERFSLTANNVTYGAMGDAFGYWKFFPAPDGQGRIPVWGFATVVKSAAPDVAEGLRLFGYLPMSTHFIMRLAKGRRGYVDTAAHRAELPPTYNAYAEAPADALDDHRALLRPLLMTSFLLDDFLGEDAAVTTLVLSSASSKTAMGLAWFARRRGMTVTGLSSPGNLEGLAALGLYDRILPYDRAAELKTDGATAYVDFAGNRAVTATVHTALGDRLTRSLIVGGTHWEAGRGDAALLAGVQPVLFFAPDQIRKRSAEWGPQVVTERFEQGLADFVAANPWLTLVQHQGAEGLKAAYSDVIEGRARPQDGHIIRPA